jgi:pimeloyl-ACP methyl ester carboxylesterase
LFALLDNLQNRSCKTPLDLESPSRLVVFFSCLAALEAKAAPEPHFIVLPGIEGPSPCARGIVLGLRQTHPDATFEIFDWTTGSPTRMLYHVQAWNRNVSVAGSLAAHIASLQARQPDRPIVLIGHSGGGAMAIMVLDLLPPSVSVQQVILLAPDISPTYPLSTALERTVQGIDLFYSNLDCFVLGAATYTVGTIDRIRTPAAGMLGFRSPPSSDTIATSLYATKLHQHAYDPAMSLTGHFGGHLTCTLPEFVSRYVSSVLR